MARNRRKHSAQSGQNSPDHNRSGARVATNSAPAVAGLCVLLVVLVVAVYSPAFSFPFVNWDDAEYVTANAHVATGLSWANLKYAFTTQVAGNWHPLTMLSHMVDVQLFGLDAGWHHLVNVVFHGATTIALFLLLRGTTGSIGRSAFVAALFAVHPLHVESVAWVSERKDVLSTFLALLAMAAYAGYVRQQTWGSYVAALAFYCLALLSKPMVVTLPVLLLLFDLWPLRRVVSPGDFRSWWILVREKLPFLLAALATSLITLATQGKALAGFDVLPLTRRLSNAIAGYGFYLLKTVWPHPLAAFYPMGDPPVASLVSLVAAFAVLSAGAVRLSRRAPFLTVGWFWFLIALLPVSGLLQAGEQAAADRYMYLPIVGLFVIAAWSSEFVSVPWRRVMPAIGVALVLACAVTAKAQVRTWADSQTLWRHAISVTSGNYIAYEKLGDAQRDLGVLDDARRNYEQAITLAPPNSPKYLAIIYNSLGIVAEQQGRAADALASFERAAPLNPDFAEARSNLGAALAKSGRVEEAAEHFLAAVSLTPESAESVVGLAGVRLTQGRNEEALKLYQQAVALQPDLAEAHAGIGSAAAALGRNDEARAALQQALRLKPTLTSARVRLANLLVRSGQIDDAIQELQRAIAADPRQASWHYGLAILLIERNRLEEARQELHATLELQPGHVEAQQALSRIR